MVRPTHSHKQKTANSTELTCTEKEGEYSKDNYHAWRGEKEGEYSKDNSGSGLHDIAQGWFPKRSSSSWVSPSQNQSIQVWFIIQCEGRRISEEVLNGNIWGHVGGYLKNMGKQGDLKCISTFLGCVFAVICFCLLVM